MIPEVLAMVPMVLYVVAILIGADGGEDELVVPYLIAQIAGFGQYFYALHLRFKYHDGSRR